MIDICTERLSAGTVYRFLYNNRLHSTSWHADLLSIYHNNLWKCTLYSGETSGAYPQNGVCAMNGERRVEPFSVAMQCPKRNNSKTNRLKIIIHCRTLARHHTYHLPYVYRLSHHQISVRENFHHHIHIASSRRSIWLFVYSFFSPSSSSSFFIFFLLLLLVSICLFDANTIAFLNAWSDWIN